jgi:ribosomal peptide maturation radical SAM protein 1
MPFGALERPAISLGLLKSHCDRLEVPCDIRYLTFEFAELIGLGDYLWLCSDEVPYTAFAGDWLFSTALYGARPYADAAYVDEVLERTWALDGAAVARLWRVRGHVEPFLEQCLCKVQWGDYTFVGFTSVFQQNLASLALAARIKRAHPDLTIAFGGANWEEVMGEQLQKQFPFVDLVFSGEADESFPAVLRARKEGSGPEGIPGVALSTRIGVAAVSPAQPVRDMNGIPVPNYDAFFEQFRASCVSGAISPSLLIETARGCWWGERSHCTFCGLNGATMAFRSKTPDRVVAEIADLRARYDVRTFNVVDDILDINYFKSVLPRLVEAKLGIDFFWEIKANLSPHHVRLLRDAGVTSVQPGIESLSDNVLKLMRKGTTAFRNIELLKWCKEYGVKPYWNFLYGFPGETREDYDKAISLLRAIWHLDPPTGYGPIRLDRFSPYHKNPNEFGMINIRPLVPFTYLYPFEPRKLSNIAYYFDFDYEDGRGDTDYAHTAIETVREWMAQGDRGLLAIEPEPDRSLRILDTRGSRRDNPREAVLSGWKAAVYLATDRAQPFASLTALDTVQKQKVGPEELRTFLERCVEHNFMVANGQHWLNVGVHVPARELPDR